jgi:type III secretion protein C
MRYLNMTRWTTVLMVIASLSWASMAQATTPANWKDIGFSIDANGMKLRDVLNEFGVAYGVQVAISAKEQGAMKGRLKAESGSEFLDRLTHAHDFRWFVYGGTLYIVPRDDNISLRLEVGEDAVQDAKAALIGVGLFDARFGWGELPDEGVVLVNGPREYVNLARDVLLPEAKKQSAKEKQIMIFRLKYASASDRVITTRGEKETIPGIKTILKGLLGQDSPEKSSDYRDRIDVASGKRSRAPKADKGGTGERIAGSRAGAEYTNGDEDGADTSRAAKTKTTSRDDRPRIDADTSLNAIIIYDNASKRGMYQALIAELDVEPQQIEIEALIVDIDRSKLSDLGVEWSVKSGNTVVTVNGNKTDSVGLDLPIPGATMLISNAARFYARLRALENAGEAHVLAKPTVLTLDNVAAVLDLSQTTYVPLVGERVADLANITAGTMLRVVPRVLREGANTRVRLEVDIEDGTLGDPALKTNVTRSTISTQAIIDMQQTLMIGGYHSESKSQNNQKIPLLGDVPLLGGLFRSTTESHSTRERLFMITPRLSGTTGVAASAQSDLSRVARETAIADRDRKVEQPKTVDAAAAAVLAAAPAAVPAAAPAAAANNVPVNEWAVQNTSPKLADATGGRVQRIPRKPVCARPRLGFDLLRAG